MLQTLNLICFQLSGSNIPLTAIKLKDVEFTARVVEVNGVSTSAAGVVVTFREEKYDDIQGPRSAQDHPDEHGAFEKDVLRSCAFWLYRLMVVRDVFERHDPIRSAHGGESLTIERACMEFYLFCDVTPNAWVDTAPVSTHTIGRWTKVLLKRMGSQPRGFSAHRSGIVTRACILAILESEGKEISPGRMDVIIRWGGWQCVTGEKTVMRIYARKVIDAYMDNYALSYGRQPTKDEWAQKMTNYTAVEIQPKTKPCDPGRHLFPMQIRLHAWRGKRWQRFLHEMNRCMAVIIAAAKCSPSIMPVARYVQDRRAFSLYCTERPHDAEVVIYKKLKEGRVGFLRGCIEEVIERCAIEAAKWAKDVVDRMYWRQRLWLADVREVAIGNISIDRGVRLDDLHTWNADVFKFGNLKDDSLNLQVKDTVQ